MIGSKSRLFAKGRMKAGQMNKTESEYFNHLRSLKYSGQIVDFWFESIKLKVAENRCDYTPDFLVQMPDGSLELHEVKGSPKIFQDDAKVKCKVCADKYPFKLKVVYPRPKKNGGGWIEEDF